MLLAACTCSAPEPPWWVAWSPIVAAFVGLVGGVAGVWIGSWMQSRATGRQWLLDRRTAAYDELRVQAHRFAKTTSRYFKAPNDENRKAVEDGLWELDMACTRVELIATSSVVDRARAVLDHASDTMYPMTGTGMAITDAQRDAVMAELTKRIGEYFDAARADVRNASGS